MGEDRRQRAAQRVDQAMVARRPADIDRDHAAWAKVVPRALEELSGCQIERDVGLAIGIDEDHVVVPGRGRHPVPAVGHDHIEITLGHPEVASPHLDDLRIELDPIDR